MTEASVHRPPIDSTSPGPFQKYLFSGACYVQIGRCYQLINDHMQSGEPIRFTESLHDELAAIWSSYLIQHPGLALGNFINTEPETKPLVEWYQELQNAGLDVAKKCASMIEQSDQSEYDLQTFFVQWASACDQTYEQLTRTEACAKAMGYLINTMLKSNRLQG